jgi:hypothetical protein
MSNQQIIKGKCDRKNVFIFSKKLFTGMKFTTHYLRDKGNTFVFLITKLFAYENRYPTGAENTLRFQGSPDALPM